MGPRAAAAASAVAAAVGNAAASAGSAASAVPRRLRGLGRGGGEAGQGEGEGEGAQGAAHEASSGAAPARSSGWGLAGSWSGGALAAALSGALPSGLTALWQPGWRLAWPRAASPPHADGQAGSSRGAALPSPASASNAVAFSRQPAASPSPAAAAATAPEAAPAAALSLLGALQLPASLGGPVAWRPLGGEEASLWGTDAQGHLQPRAHGRVVHAPRTAAPAGAVPAAGAGQGEAGGSAAWRPLGGLLLQAVCLGALAAAVAARALPFAQHGAAAAPAMECAPVAAAVEGARASVADAPQVGRAGLAPGGQVPRLGSFHPGRLRLVGRAPPRACVLRRGSRLGVTSDASSFVDASSSSPPHRTIGSAGTPLSSTHRRTQPRHHTEAQGLVYVRKTMSDWGCRPSPSGSHALRPATPPAWPQALAAAAARVCAAAPLDGPGAAALLRAWVAAQAAAPGLASPAERHGLLARLAGGRALRHALAAAEAEARAGRCAARECARLLAGAAARLRLSVRALHACAAPPPRRRSAVEGVEVAVTALTARGVAAGSGLPARLEVTAHVAAWGLQAIRGALGWAEWRDGWELRATFAPRGQAGAQGWELVEVRRV
jgi:hypothetical protein